MEDEEEAMVSVEDEGFSGIYITATIAECDRSCELRAGNLGTVYANLREEGAGKGGRDGMMGGRSAVVEMSARRARMRTRVRGCIDTSLRRWFVIL